MRTTTRVTLAAAAVGASFAFMTPAAFAQAACEYPFDCPTGGGGGAGGGGAGGGAVAGPTGGGGSALPVTGGELVLMTTAGAGALVAGTVLVVAGRRRGAKA